MKQDDDDENCIVVAVDMLRLAFHLGDCVKIKQFDFEASSMKDMIKFTQVLFLHILETIKQDVEEQNQEDRVAVFSAFVAGNDKLKDIFLKLHEKHSPEDSDRVVH